MILEGIEVSEEDIEVVLDLVNNNTKRFISRCDSIDCSCCIVSTLNEIYRVPGSCITASKFILSKIKDKLVSTELLS